MMTLKGGITVTSGGHRLDNLITVGTDAEWNIAASSSLTRAGNVDTLTMAADRKITKTGAGTLVLQQASANMLGVLEVQQGVLQVRTVENALGGATLALNGGMLEIFSNNTRTNNNATTAVIGGSERGIASRVVWHDSLNGRQIAEANYLRALSVDRRVAWAGTPSRRLCRFRAGQRGEATRLEDPGFSMVA